MEAQMGPLAIYVATRLTAKHPVNYLHNLQESMDVAIELWRKGHHPYVPGLDFLLIMQMRDVIVSDIYEASLDFMSRCDAILVHNGVSEVDGDNIRYNPDYRESSGVRKELEVAQKIGMIVFWSLDEVPDVKPCTVEYI